MGYFAETLSFTLGNLKHFSKTPRHRVTEKTTHTCVIKFIRYILDLYPQVGKDFLINRTIDALMGDVLFSYFFLKWVLGLYLKKGQDLGVL